MRIKRRNLNLSLSSWLNIYMYLYIHTSLIRSFPSLVRFIVLFYRSSLIHTYIYTIWLVGFGAAHRDRRTTRRNGERLRSIQHLSFAFLFSSLFLYLAFSEGLGGGGYLGWAESFSFIYVHFHGHISKPPHCLASHRIYHFEK